MIQYQLLYKAAKYYQKLGFEYVEVPWIVSQEAGYTTRKEVEAPPIPVDEAKDELVGSGEQGFIEWMLQGIMKPGKFQSITPCFRIEPRYDELHLPYFMKLELIHAFKGEDLPTEYNPLNLMLQDALRLMSQDIECKSIDLLDGSKDIVTLRGVELGSYGIRSAHGWTWVYGTGLAEPRFSSQIRGNR